MKRLRLDRTDWWILLFTVIIYIILINTPFKTKPFGDAYFHNEAKLLSVFIKGDIPLDKVVITHAPGPVIFYTFPYLFVKTGTSDNNYWYAGVIWTAMWMFFCMVLIRRAARNIFNENTGRLSALLFAVFPLHIYYSLGIIAESIAFFSAIVMIYGWSLWRHSGYNNFLKSRGWWLMVLGMSYLILSRPNTLFILGLMVLVIIGAYFKNKALFKLTLRGLSFAIVLTFLSAYSTMEIVKRLPGNPKQDSQSNVLLYVIHEGRFQFRNEPFDWRYWQSSFRGKDSRDYQDWVKSQDSLSAFRKTHVITNNELYKNFIITDISQHPFLAIRAFFIRAIYGHIYVINNATPSQFGVGKIRGNFIYILVHLLINLLNIVILIAAIIFMFRKKRYLLEFWPLWLPWLALIIFHGFSYMEPRYMMPSRPGLFIMAAEVMTGWSFIRKRLFKATKPEEPNEIEFAS